MQVIETPQYRKKILKFLKKHPELFSRYKKTIQLIESNIFHPSLRLHNLEGSLEGLKSVSINISYRITLVLQIEKNEVTPISIGSHDEVYK